MKNSSRTALTSAQRDALEARFGKAAKLYLDARTSQLTASSDAPRTACICAI